MNRSGVLLFVVPWRVRRPRCRRSREISPSPSLHGASTDALIISAQTSIAPYKEGVTFFIYNTFCNISKDTLNSIANTKSASSIVRLSIHK